MKLRWRFSAMIRCASGAPSTLSRTSRGCAAGYRRAPAPTDEPHRVDGTQAVLGQLVARRRLEHEPVAVLGRERLELLAQPPLTAVRRRGRRRCVERIDIVVPP